MRARKTRRKTRSVRVQSPTDSQSPFDVDKYMAYLQSLVPKLQIESADFSRYEATIRIRRFVSHFTFWPNGDVTYIWPHWTDLAWFAKQFRDYLKSSSTLDEAFGLKGTKRGRGSAKAKLHMRDREIQARTIYLDLTQRGVSIKQALAMVAKELRCSESTANSLIYRIRSQPRSKGTVRN